MHDIFSNSQMKDTAQRNRPSLICLFTLVELLTVIAVISILCSVLLPAVLKAKYKASQITCMNNLKQLGFGINSYAADNQDWIIMDQPDVAYTYWAQNLIAQEYIGMPRNYAYNAPSGIFGCTLAPKVKSSQWRGSTYGLNYLLNRGSSGTFSPSKFSQIKNISKVCLAGEGAVVPSLSSTPNGMIRERFEKLRPERRHDGTWNSLFADFHTGAVKRPYFSGDLASDIDLQITSSVIWEPWPGKY